MKLAELLDDPGFTPGARHFNELFELLDGEREQAERASRVLARAGLPAARAALAELERATPRARSHLIDLLGRIARSSPEPEIVERVLAALTDPEPRTRRSAIRALGKLSVAGAEQRLLALWAAAEPAERRALAAALGKIGGERSLSLLGGLSSDDPELARIARKSALMLARTLERAGESSIELDRRLPEASSVCLRCRAGISRVLAAEARALGPILARTEREVVIAWDGSLSLLLGVRTALDRGLVAGLGGAPGEHLEERIGATLLRREVRAALAAWTRGKVRFRLAFAEGGHRRALVWRLAGTVAERVPELVNDPTNSPWELVVDERADRLLLCPRGFDDPRFAYRKRDVRGASHPTIAAALAREAGARPDDVVWDPFAGGGVELIERAKLGPYRELHASDLDAAALSAARENFAAADLEPASMDVADARFHRVPEVTLIVTNPPMGRRVARHAGLCALLRAFLANAWRNLERGGRLVWLSPMPERTSRAASSLGFTVTRKEAVDLGGFSAELQILRKGARPT